MNKRGDLPYTCFPAGSTILETFENPGIRYLVNLNEAKNFVFSTTSKSFTAFRRTEKQVCNQLLGT
jgi:hypothetical protein